MEEVGYYGRHTVILSISDASSDKVLLNPYTQKRYQKVVIKKSIIAASWLRVMAEWV